MITFLKNFFRPEWEYGTCKGKIARRGKEGNVQFVMWKAGEQGHTEDYWVDYSSYWWTAFKAKK
jgi:hypothetical protein